jgi:WD40 repeat protein
LNNRLIPMENPMNNRFAFIVRALIPVAAVALLPLVSVAASSLSPVWTKAGHAARVTDVACSPNGSFIATCSDDYTVKIWSTNGTLVNTMNTSPSPALTLAFSPDGSKLAVGTYFGGYVSGTVGGISGSTSVPGVGLVYLWQAPSGWDAANITLAWIRTNAMGKISSVGFSSDSARLVYSTSGGSNYVCSATDGSLVKALSGYSGSVGPAAVTSSALSSQGWLVSGCEDKTIRLWKATWSSQYSNTTSHASNVTSVAFTPNGASFVSGCLDGSVRLFSTNGTFKKGYNHGVEVTSVAVSPDGSKIVSGALDGTIKIWNTNATLLSTISAHSNSVTSVAFTTDSSRVVSGGEDAAVRIWSVANGTLLQTIGDQQAYVGEVAISPDGALCASAGGDSAILVRRVDTGATVFTLAGHSNFVSALAFSPNSAILASGGGPLDPTIKFWSMTDGSLLKTIAAGTNGVTVLAFSVDGSLLASGSDFTEQTISLWSVATGTLVKTLAGHSSGVTALTFSADGKYLASGGRRQDRSAIIWSLANGSIVASLAGTTVNTESLAFLPDGSSLAVGSSGTGNLKLWTMAQSSCYTIGNSTNPVYSLAFSPDGSTLASVDGNSIVYWNAKTAAEIETVTQNTYRLTSLAFSPNNNLLLVGQEDGSVTLFNNTRGALSQSALMFSQINANPISGVGFEASVQPGTRFVIQSSTNLTNWTYLGQVSSVSNTLSVSGLPLTNAASGFIRAITPP